MRYSKQSYFILVIVAAIGIVMAFKAERFSKHFIYTGKLKSGVCTTKVKGSAIMGGTPNVAASTVALKSGCPDAFTVSVSDD
jgi:hypothetical protein